ncbi:MAG: MBL fold metallo-hydrolase [Clostridia bacterium]|nr:MBL fold metallo-hydrolase [Clostridia bacterium]
MIIKQIKSKFFRGLFGQNTYAILNKKSAVIIDAGANIEDLIFEIGNRKVQAVLVTHLHFDHIYYIERILKEFNCPVYIQKGFDEKFYDANKNVSLNLRQNLTFNVQENQIKYYEDELEFDGLKFKIYKTPGHSADGVCIKIDEFLFTGDTIFDDSIGRFDFYDSDFNQLKNSLKIIGDIDFEVAYPGHGEACSKDQILNTISFYID